MKLASSKKTNAIGFYLNGVTQSVRPIAIEQTVGTRAGSRDGSPCLVDTVSVWEDRKVLELGGLSPGSCH